MRVSIQAVHWELVGVISTCDIFLGRAMAFIDPLPGVMREAMNRIIALPHDEQSRIAQENGYEFRVYGRAFDLAAAFEELEHLLEFLQRARTFPEISLVIKLYTIGWVALSDVLANLVNEVFDLGYAEQDVQFGVILRNRKIKESSIPGVVKQHAKPVRYDDFVRRRNDIVHRGKLDDSELTDMRGQVFSAVVLKTMMVDMNDAEAVAEASRDAVVEVNAAGKMQQLLNHKKAEFAEHLTATRAMFAELSPSLVERVKAQQHRATA